MSMTGKYNYVKSENFDEYMQATGMGFAFRKLAAASKPTAEITKSDDDFWRIKTSSTFKTTDIQFKSGEPFDEVTPDGRKCKSIVQVQENKMIHDLKCTGVDFKVIREFSGDEMVITMIADGVTAKRYYKKDGTVTQ